MTLLYRLSRSGSQQMPTTKIIYLDNAATTPVAPEVVEAMRG